MDLLGAWIFGFIIGIIFCYIVIKTIAKKNKNSFLTELSNKYSDTPKGEMIVDAIGSELDVLIKYHGERVKVEDGYYIMCWIDNDPLVLPSRCLVPIHDSTESESDL